MGGPANHIRVTVLVDGIQREEALDTKSTVKQIIGELLPSPGQGTRADDCQLSTKDGPALDLASVLEDDGIPGGSVLALTKKDGGGCRCRGIGACA